jgi:hypothetical protein
MGRPIAYLFDALGQIRARQTVEGGAAAVALAGAKDGIS